MAIMLNLACLLLWLFASSTVLGGKDDLASFRRQINHGQGSTAQPTTRQQQPPQFHPPPRPVNPIAKSTQSPPAGHRPMEPVGYPLPPRPVNKIVSTVDQSRPASGMESSQGFTSFQYSSLALKYNTQDYQIPVGFPTYEAVARLWQKQPEGTSVIYLNYRGASFTLLRAENRIYCFNNAEAGESGAQGKVVPGYNLSTKEKMAIKISTIEKRKNFGPSTRQNIDNLMKEPEFQGWDKQKQQQASEKLRISDSTNSFLEDIKNEHAMSKKTGLATNDLFFSPDGHLSFMVLKFFDGMTLQEVLKSNDDIWLQLPTRLLFEKSIEAVKKLNLAGIKHGDFSINNVMIGREAAKHNQIHVKIIDFGAAFDSSKNFPGVNDEKQWENVFLYHYFRFNPAFRIEVHPSRQQEFDAILGEYAEKFIRQPILPEPIKTRPPAVIRTDANPINVAANPINVAANPINVAASPEPPKKKSAMKKMTGWFKKLGGRKKGDNGN